ncbi:MAG: DUF1287 domain-containing protein [Acidobacteria bacterium]|nr:DUF1287 domain-containing protein [Acidobacteriota bacterium]
MRHDVRSGVRAALLAVLPAALLTAAISVVAPPATGSRPATDARAAGDVPPLNRVILEGARKWLERAPRYDPSYFRLDYPGGDVPPDRGVCTDLIVRALRHAGIDLQVLIHEDRLARPEAYPREIRVDRNLDHRRTAVQIVYFRKHARPLVTRTDPGHLSEWLPGDLVFYGRNRVWHAGIVSDRRSPAGIPYIIDSHQDGGGVSERFLLTHWGAILAHFRLPEPPG